MAAVQFMCAKLGMVTGCGLASVIRNRYSRWVLWLAASLVIIANVFNIGADLGGMADAMQMMTRIPSFYWTPFFAAVIVALLFWTSYRLMARIFKWLTLVLFAYIITAFFGPPRLAGSVSLDVCTASRMEQILYRCIGSHSWHDHLALSFLLAGRPRGGRRPRSWKSDGRAAQGLHERRGPHC
jgi:Mn2+/Fe2+ NRAMP family transporter